MDLKNYILRSERFGKKVFRYIIGNNIPVFMLYESDQGLNCELKVFYFDENKKAIVVFGESSFILNDKDNTCYINCIENTKEGIGKGVGKAMICFIEDVARQYDIFKITGEFNPYGEFKDRTKKFYDDLNFRINGKSLEKNLEEKEEKLFDVLNYKAYFERYPNINKR